MCTRTNEVSVPDSLRVLAGSFVGLVAALATLVVALVTAPVHLLVRRPAKHGNPASTRHVEVQVHLDDGKRAGEIKRGCQSALRRAARTFAPHALPLDRVEVLFTAPPLGKTDIYETWVEAPGEGQSHSLVVVSLGMGHDQRRSTPDEIAGALFSQIQLLVDDQYRRQHNHGAQAAVAITMPERQPTFVSLPAEPSVKEISDPPARTDNVIQFKSVQELLADIKKSQPLVTAGSSANGTHLEPDTAS